MKKIILAVLLALFVLPLAGQAREFVVRTPSTAEALAAARVASQKTGISATILMGVFRQESGGGVNVGRDPGEWASYCSTHSGVACDMWEGKDCKPGYGNAQHFPEIIAALGYDKQDVMTSFTCALGFMQVEPATWWNYRSGDPWNVSDAMLVSAKYLKYLKEHPNNTNHDDITALAMYYCGPGGADNPECQSYADGVVEKAGLSADAYGLPSFRKEVATLTFINIGQQIKGAVDFLKNQKVADKTNEIVSLMSFQPGNVQNYCKGESCQYSYTEEICTKNCSDKNDCCLSHAGGTPCCYFLVNGVCGSWEEYPECNPMSITGGCCEEYKSSVPRIANCALSPPCNPVSPNDDPCPSTIEIGPGETKTFEGILMEAQAAAAKIGAISTDAANLGKYETELEKAVERMKKCMEDEDEFILGCTDTKDWFEEGGVIPVRAGIPAKLKDCKPGLDFYCMNAEGEEETAEAMTFPIAPLKETADKLDNLLKAADQCKCERVKYACDLTLPNNYTELMCKCPIGTSCNANTQELFCKLTANEQCSNDCKPIEVGSSPFRVSVKAIGNTPAIPGFKDIKKGIANTTIPLLRGYYTALENSIGTLGEAYGKEDEQRGVVYTCSDMKQVLKSFLETGDIKYCPSSGAFKCCPPIDSAGVKLVQEIKNCEATDFFFCGDEIAITLTPLPIVPGTEPPPLPPTGGNKTIPFSPAVEKQWQDASEPLQNLLLCIYNNFPETDAQGNPTGGPGEILAISDINIKDRGGTDGCDYKKWRDSAVIPGLTPEQIAGLKGDCQENSGSWHYGRSTCQAETPGKGFSFAVDFADTTKIDTIVATINNGNNKLKMKDESGNDKEVPCRDLFSGPGGTRAVKGDNVKIEKKQNETGDGHIHLWAPISTPACYPEQ